jgi:hypothetical protein
MPRLMYMYIIKRRNKKYIIISHSLNNILLYDFFKEAFFYEAVHKLKNLSKVK